MRLIEDDAMDAMTIAAVGLYWTINEPVPEGCTTGQGGTITVL